MRRESLILAVLTFFLVVPLVVGQTATPLPFTMRVQQANSVLNVADGATITMPADAIGIASTAVLTVTYRGTTTTSSATLNTVDFSGSLDFTVSGIPELPLNMTPGQSFALNIQYKPSNSQRNSARVAFSYVEGRTVAGFGLNLSGTAPEFAFSYVPQGGNATIIAPSGTIPYPVTPVNTTVNASFVVTNRGTGAGVVNAITVSGGAEFQLAGLPLPATSVDAGKDLRFTVSFTPKQLPAVRGLLSIVFVDSAVAFILEGSG